MATLADLLRRYSGAVPDPQPDPAALAVALRRNSEYGHQASAPIESIGGDPLTDWAQGVRQRVTHPLETMAAESQRWQSMRPEEMAMQVGPSGGSLSGLAGMFIGKGAKVWDAVQAARAAEMEAAGHAPEAIWKETGTFKGADGNWRQEIPDNMMMYRGAHAGNYADEAIHHPELFKAYPQLGGGRVQEVPGSGGSYTEHPMGGTGTFQIGIDGFAANTSAHELQHAIQEREGWARGGSPDALQLEYNNARARLNFLEKEPDLIEGQKKIDALWSDVFDTQKISPEQAAEIERGIYSAHPSLKEAKDVMQTLRTVGDDSGYNAYKRLAGEAEARLTQARMNMTPEQRAASYPPSMFDVPMDQQIVRFK